MGDHTTDIEKASDTKEHSVEVTEEHGPHHYADGVPRRQGILGKVRFPNLEMSWVSNPLPQLWDIVDRLDGVESRGIERVLPNERNHTQRLSDCMWMWLAANTTTSTFSLGTLGASVFGLEFRPAVLTIIFFNLLSTIPVAYFSTFGPKLGLRQLTLSRFSFSLYFPNCFPIILNSISCIGCAAVNSITAALTLRAVSEGNQTRIPSAAAIVIIAILTLVPSFIGYRYVHAYERYSWIPVAIVFFIVLGLAAPHFDSGGWGDAPSNVTAASVLSFGSTIVGYGLGWSSLAADCTVNFPEE